MSASITPITSLTLNSIRPIEHLIKLDSMLPDGNKINAAANNNNSFSFTDMLKGMLNTVNVTDAETKTDAMNLAVGYIDMQDLHNIEINALKADLALRTVTSLRNKALEAYSEIMRITI